MNQFPGAPFLRRVIENLILPLGLLLALTGFFAVGERSTYVKIFYWGIFLPVIFYLSMVDTKPIADFFRSSIFRLVFIFLLIAAGSLFWSPLPAGESIELLKRPLFVFLFAVACIILSGAENSKIDWIIKLSAVLSIGAAAYTLVAYYMQGAAGRLGGYGILSNPLLVSHVFGFYLAIWIGMFVTKQFDNKWMCFTAFGLIGILLTLTGSRTPLLAISATVLWLAVVAPSKRSRYALLGLCISGLVIFITFYSAIAERGTSYRPEIWTYVVSKASENFWLGHGYGASLAVELDVIPVLTDPHNLSLSVFHQLGFVGLVIWLSIYVVAFKEVLGKKSDPWIVILSTALVYGLFAGMTEGGGFLSRPKETWFLVWIPLSLLVARLEVLTVND